MTHPSSKLLHHVWVIGAGQLGRMMQYAGAPLGIEVHPVNVDDPQLPAPQIDAEACHQHVVTAERELWPQTPSGQYLQAQNNFKNKDVFGLLADRKTQKELIDRLGIGTAPWHNIDAGIKTQDLYQSLGDTVLLKRRSGGYDGRGQLWLKQANNDVIPDDWFGSAIAEQKCPFDEELSLVGARSTCGKLVFYPLTLNLHVNGILMASIAPLKRVAQLQAQAEKMLGAILNDLDYVGVMAMECFRMGDELIINELAPRVHNSGHWTQAGASMSQFEMHLRAVCSLPLPQPVIAPQNVMINLIGTDKNNAWLDDANAQLHWYNKSVRVGRKLGHINFSVDDNKTLSSSLQALKTKLARDDYNDVIEWVCEEIKK